MAASKEALATAECPVARAVDVVGDRWSLLILRDVFDGIGRFGELQRNLDLSRNTLTERLRTLVAHGILEVRPASDGTAYGEYALTAKGADLFTVLVAVRQWGERYLFADGEPHSVLLDTEAGAPVAALEPHGADDRPITHRDAHVRKATRDAPEGEATTRR